MRYDIYKYEIKIKDLHRYLLKHLKEYSTYFNNEDEISDFIFEMDIKEVSLEIIREMEKSNKKYSSKKIYSFTSDEDIRDIEQYLYINKIYPNFNYLNDENDYDEEVIKVFLVNDIRDLNISYKYIMIKSFEKIQKIFNEYKKREGN